VLTNTTLGAAAQPASRLPVLYVGAPDPSWLGRFRFPMLVSRARLSRLKKKFPTAITPWILDSAGFKHVEANGRWLITAQQYAEEAQKWMERIGRLVAAAPQDWMCEPEIRRVTGKSVQEHQELTIANFLLLRQLAPTVPWMPVLQGWLISEYRRHIEMYAAAGVDLTQQKRVGVGSVCRRQDSIRISLLMRELASRGMHLHGFGVKTRGLDWYGEHLGSIDSAAWSYHARREGDRTPGCEHSDCRNCPAYAQWWHADLVDRGLVSWPKTRLDQGLAT
jgi:hypothetical protein